MDPMDRLLIIIHKVNTKQTNAKMKCEAKEHGEISLLGIEIKYAYAMENYICDE